MMKRYTVAVIGCGNRGSGFATMMSGMPDKYEVVSLCDISEKQIPKTEALAGLKNTEFFLDPDEFFQKKRADILVIATPDRLHVPQAIKALKLGYDLLLEKPISDSREKLELLLRTQEETGRTVVVCHELRYGVGFRKCAELLDSGIIGKLYAIDASERVRYWHWAQAYVRGIGASIEDGHPAILAKCSHDLDLVQAYAKSKCDTVSSIGDLSFFRPENAPEGAAYRCLDCKHRDTCVYSAKRIYIDGWHEQGEPTFKWPFNKASLTNPHTEESLRKGLREGEYGVCAFRCKVEKVDHQFVQMRFQNGVVASLKMVYAYEPGRRLAFYGNYGEIVFDERSNTIEVAVFGKPREIIRIETPKGEVQKHGGGDIILVREMYDILSGVKPCTTPLSESLESHLMGIAAEESRRLDGQIVKVHQSI